MSIFEFLSVTVSIVLALALGRLIGAAPYVFAPATRGYIHSGFFLATNFSVLATWLHVWTLSGKETWNFLEFLVLMGSPIALYLAAQILVSNVPSDVSDWKAHFARTYRYYYGSILVSVVFTLSRAAWVHNADSRVLLGLGVLCLIFVIGILANRVAVHLGVLFCWVLFQMFAVAERFTAV